MKSILVVHALSHRMRRTTIDFVMSFGRYAPPEMDVTYHNLRKPKGRKILDRTFDAMILPYDILALRAADEWDWVIETILPLADASGQVIAMPQDDYTHNVVLDTALHELGTDIIYTPIETGLDVVYPTMSHEAEIRRALTGYVDERTKDTLDRFRLPMSERLFDVGQRVRMLPPWFGREGMEKGLLAELFRTKSEGSGLRTDISTDPSDVFDGDDWYRFLGSCRATLGQKGGASLCDPDGSIHRRVLEFLGKHPGADFDEVEAACFPDSDSKVVMKAVSPRLFDAAMLHTVQILIEDDYLGVMEPWVHYIPTDRELSNFDEISSTLRDTPTLVRIANAAAEVLIESHQFTYRRFVTDVCSDIVEGAGRPTDIPAGVDVGEEIQWRLTPELFEALQRCIRVAWSVRDVESLIRLTDSAEALLSENPNLAGNLDARLLYTVAGRTETHLSLASIVAPFVEILDESFLVGALPAVRKWLRWAETPEAGFWHLRDWVDKPRIDLDSQVST